MSPSPALDDWPPVRDDEAAAELCMVAIFAGCRREDEKAVGCSWSPIRSCSRRTGEDESEADGVRL